MKGLDRKIKTVSELEDILIENKGVSFYGAGKVCCKILDYLELKSEINYVKGIFVTKHYFDSEESHGIIIDEYYRRNTYVDKFPLIISVVSSVARTEISKLLEKEGENQYFVLDEEFEKILNHTLGKMKYERAKEKILEFIKEPENDKKSQDIRFFSLPYWDAYAPFSAVPCLVARLQNDGYKTGQIDLGILCIHWCIENRWREAASICISQEFYDQNIKDYKKNPYICYEDFLKDMWFFHGDHFNIDLVKTEYTKMNPVQKRIVDTFYSNLSSLDSVMINFDQCENLKKAVDEYCCSNFLDEIISKKIISVFQGLPPIIGLSITGVGQFLPACLFAKIIKEVCPDKIIIMGGSCADLFVRSQYKMKSDIYNYFDYIIVGEGETAISMLMNCLLNKQKKFDEIPNLLHLNNEQPYFVKQIVENVDELPMPSYEGLDLELYVSPEKMLAYQSSRGCHYGYCAFCNHDEKYRHHYRSKNMEKVVKELMCLSRLYGVNNFQFVDEAIRPDCFRKMIDEMDQYEEFKHINWLFYSRVSREYDEELLEKAKKNGCKMVMFGVETFNQRLLKFIRKGISAETSRYCLKLFHDAGIKTFVWLMCNLPSETLEEVEEDLICVKQMEKYIDAFSVGPFSLSKNTDMYREPEKYNIIFIDEADPCRFTTHYKGEIIDKDGMLDFYKYEYLKYQMNLFSTGNRYTLFYEKIC